MKALNGKVIRASGFQTMARGEIDHFENALVAIGAEGAIEQFIRPDDPAYPQILDEAKRAGTFCALPENTYLLPGFVDLHIHAPQYPQLGTALDVPLEVWLQKYTFPLEARYADIAFARRGYNALVDDLLACGTTTAMYFGTIHDDANRLLADICLQKGQRALIGKVAMDNHDECPDYYRDESSDAAIAGTASLIDYIRHHPDNGDGRVKPVVTPRFIPSCSDATLEGLGNLAQETGCHVQTHCSESDWEHHYVQTRHGMSDTESLERFGLLKNGAVLAHSNFLSLSDMERIKAREAAVAHCPLSNAYFANAVFPLKLALEKGLHVGLGTDISGGAEPSIFHASRMAMTASRMLESGTDPHSPAEQRSAKSATRIDFRDAFYLATTGGAKSVGLPVGNFQPGNRFDAMLIDPEARLGSIRLWEELYQGEQILQKILYTASRPNIAGVWVDGVLRSENLLAEAA